MKLNKPITLAVFLLFISTILVIITFSLVYWLSKKSNLNDYGMWQGCSINGTVCARWYDNGQPLFQFYMTDAFKAFQGLQVIFLVSLFSTTISLLINMQFYPNKFWFYVINCFIIFISNLCALASLLVFVVNVYDSSLHSLSWCYWVSVGVIGLNLIVMIIICIHTIRLKQKPKELSKQSLINDFSEPKQIIQEPKMTRIEETNKKLVKTPISESKIKLEKRIINKKAVGTKSHLENGTNRLKKKSYNHHKRSYPHKHLHQPSKEQFQPGYSSEPDFIEYSLDRSYINYDSDNNNNNNNQTLPVDFDESKIESEMLNVKLPKLIYYDGVDHYARSDFKKLNKRD